VAGHFCARRFQHDSHCAAVRHFQTFQFLAPLVAYLRHALSPCICGVESGVSESGHTRRFNPAQKTGKLMILNTKCKLLLYAQPA
jgi:hypothetical protein